MRAGEEQRTFLPFWGSGEGVLTGFHLEAGSRREPSSDADEPPLVRAKTFSSLPHR